MYLIGTTLLFKALGFAREVLVAQFYGTGPVTDAYVIANSIPTVLIQALGTALAATFIPVFARVENEAGKVRAEEFTLRLLLLVFFICTIMVGVGEVFSHQLVRLLSRDRNH